MASRIIQFVPLMLLPGLHLRKAGPATPVRFFNGRAERWASYDYACYPRLHRDTLRRYCAGGVRRDDTGVCRMADSHICAGAPAGGRLGG